MLLKDRVAIITGGARGIGRGIALKFADEGCSVAIADLNTDEAQITLSELSKKGTEGLFVKCDVSDSAQVRDVVDKVINKWGKIDILINDAGIHPAQYTIVDLPEKEWDKILAVDLKGEFLFCQAVAPHMIQRKYGKIVNISSLAASHPPHPSVHYSAAKAGVLGLTYDLAVELAAYNITVNAIQPGAVRTPLWDGALSVVADKTAFFADLAKADIPMQRIGTPEDLAGAALFLASDLSAYVTGISILVAGGQPLRPLFEIKE